ncbi:DUF4314 domain-containing protein [Acetatifactor aquisgranensis]|jgi:hypothetical protein|uniref:DUF4314 domain-containing protein n=1 Tax=Acetatifactor aquisgranensis TaxID=2941233 RepID=UPI002ED48845
MRIDIREEELEALREKYPQGCRVELIKMDDPYREMPPGMRGVVTGVDDSGSIHVNWENGSSLAVVYCEDYAVKIGDGEVTVGELLRRCLPSVKAFHFMTPAGYVDLTAQDAGKILAGEMKPKGHPGTPEYAMEMEVRELLGFRCKEADVRDEQGVVSALVY